MKRSIKILFLFCFLNLNVAACTIIDSSFIETSLTLHTPTGDIFGTLTTPKKNKNIPIALLIAGSGPTDRNGNNPFAMNAGLKKLAYALADNNIASLRFDKRGIGESKAAAKSESALRFEDYINDADGWIKLLKQNKQFSKIVVIGHSEGSLIGLIAGEKADMFISIAGAGRPAFEVIAEQLKRQSKNIQDTALAIMDSLKNGKTVKYISPQMIALFRPSVQPYMISWFKYNPQTEIKKLSIPILLLQGTNDIQVSTEDADLLAKANPKAKLVLIKDMNHIFRIVHGDINSNMATYNNSDLSLADELIKSIVEFINKR